MANYPDILDSFTPKTDDTDDVMAVDVNELQTAIEALEAKVGIDNSLDTDSIDYRLATLEEDNTGINTGDQSASDFDIKDLADTTSLRSTWSGKQDALGFTPENTANKKTTITSSDTDYPTCKAVETGLAGKQASGSYEVSTNKKTDLSDNSDTYYPSQKAVKTAVDAKQATLVSGTNIKTINGETILGSGDVKTKNSQSIDDTDAITPTGNFLENEHYVTALAQALAINAPSGTPVNGNTLLIRLKSADARALTWNAIYTWIGVTKPETTTAGKVLYVAGIYNSTSEKWEMTAVVEEE